MRVIKLLSDEFVYHEQMQNGLNVYIHPKNNFVQSYASLQVDFGGRDFCYYLNGLKYDLPEGTAHFLEHMLFENNDQPLSEIFVKSNAEINAYTSRRITSYYFSCQNDFLMLLDALLENFVSYDFTDKSIEKERKIITEELSMNDDSKAYKAYKTLSAMMYQDKSIHHDIGGTKTSIKAIDKDMLCQAVKHFYHPKNMSLVLTGDIDVENTIAFLRKHNFSNTDFGDFISIQRNHPRRSPRSHKKTKLDKDLDTSIVEIGIKIPDEYFKNLNYMHLLYSNPFTNIFFGPTSKIYRELKKKNLYNFTFSTTPIIEDDYGFFNISIETNKSKQFIEYMIKALLNIKDELINPRVFNAYKRAEVGRAIKVFDDVRSSHSFVKKLLINAIEISDFMSASTNISIKDIAFYQNFFIKDNIFIVEYQK